MTAAKYTTPQYRKAKRKANEAQARGEWLVCCQPVCGQATRDIAPEQGNVDFRKATTTIRISLAQSMISPSPRSDPPNMLTAPSWLYEIWLSNLVRLVR